MDFIMQNLGFIVDIIVTALVGAYLWLSNKSKVTNDKIDALEDGLTVQLEKLKTNLDRVYQEHDRRITKLEARLDRMPTYDDINSLQNGIAGFSHAVGKIEGELTSLKTSVERLTQILLERGTPT